MCQNCDMSDDFVMYDNRNMCHSCEFSIVSRSQTAFLLRETKFSKQGSGNRICCL